MWLGALRLCAQGLVPGPLRHQWRHLQQVRPAAHPPGLFPGTAAAARLERCASHLHPGLSPLVSAAAAAAVPLRLLVRRYAHHPSRYQQRSERGNPGQALPQHHDADDVRVNDLRRESTPAGKPLLGTSPAAGSARRRTSPTRARLEVVTLQP